MQESFDISSSSGKYNVVAGLDLLEQVVSEHPDAIYMVDERLAGTLPKSVTRKILIEANEGNKSLEKMPEVLLKMREAGANRTSHLVAIGGGVIQDIATFTASIYMRGIPWTYMPTTLLGMADSCIGGKSSINMLGYKNLVGNFYPPERVLIDMAFIQTLNADQVVGGLFEAAKICYARGYQEFLAYLQESPTFPMSADNAQRVIVRALKTKKWFIETDEFDQKERLLLNFGHTFGHAMETALGYRLWLHGEAVAAGMVVAADLSARLGRIDAVATQRITRILERCGLPTRLAPGLSAQGVRELMGVDKKSKSGRLRLVLLDAIGSANIASDVDERLLLAALSAHAQVPA